MATIVALAAFEKRWNMIFESLKKKDPLGYPFFIMAITRSNLYVKSMRRMGTQWLGL